MKKLLILTIATLSFLHSTAQIRHVKGIKAIDINYGSTRFGKTFSMGFVKYFNTSIYGKVDMYFEKGEAPGLKYVSNGVDVYGAYKLLKYKGIIYVNGVGGIAGSYDSPEKGNNFTIDSSLKYGVFAGTEVEIFITDKFALVTNWNQRYLLGNLYGQKRWYASTGIRFNF